MLHLLNGDATRTAFADANLPGEVAVWRDILVEGPVSADPVPVPALAARQAFLAERLGIDPDAYAECAREQAAALEAAARHDEVVLWFEQDLFCAVNLWRLLDWFTRQPPATSVSLVYFAPAEVRGLGELKPATLAGLLAQRVSVTADMGAAGQRAWAAYVSPDPLDAVRLSHEHDAALPFVRQAFRCHLGRFPSLANGLNEVEAATLTVLGRGARGFAELFRDVSADPRVRPHGMGDVQFAAAVAGLAPLLRPLGTDLRHTQIEMTSRGRDVMAGAVDWLALRPIDTWLGGVRLVTGRPLWRWDGSAGRLVAL